MAGISAVTQSLAPTTPKTDATTSSTASTSSSSGSASTISGNDFLTLLVTELKNQDPTSSTDPNEYVNQLVAVNSLEQLININSTLSAGLGTNSSPSSTPIDTGSSGTSEANAAAMDNLRNRATAPSNTSPIAPTVPIDASSVTQTAPGDTSSTAQTAPSDTGSTARTAAMDNPLNSAIAPGESPTVQTAAGNQTVPNVNPAAKAVTNVSGGRL
jgi:flagellar basal-body rod modification protein FlgD